MTSMIKTGLKFIAGAAIAMAVVQPALAQKVPLKFWTFLATEGTDPRSAALKNVVAKFNASQDKYEVQVESINFARIDNQVIQATAAGQGPDILNVYSDLLSMHVAAKTIQPLDSYAAKAPDDFVTNAKFFQFGGKLMALPWETRVWVVGYRKDLLDKAGVGFPKTLEELATTGTKISTDQVQGVAIGASTGALAAHAIETFVPIFWGAGGELFDKEGKATINSPAGVQTLTYLRDLVTKYKAMRNTVVSMTVEDALTAMRAGTVGMTVLGSFRVNAVRNAEATGKNFVTAPIPGFSADKPTPARLAGQTLTMGANTKHPDGVFAFITHYLSTESQLEFAKAGVLPSRRSTYADASLKENAELQSWMDYGSKFGRFEATPADFPKLSEEIAKALQKTIVQNADPKQALDEAVAAYNAQKR